MLENALAKRGFAHIHIHYTKQDDTEPGILLTLLCQTNEVTEKILAYSRMYA